MAMADQEAHALKLGKIEFADPSSRPAKFATMPTGIFADHKFDEPSPREIILSFSPRFADAEVSIVVENGKGDLVITIR